MRKPRVVATWNSMRLVRVSPHCYEIEFHDREALGVEKWSHSLSFENTPGTRLADDKLHELRYSIVPILESFSRRVLRKRRRKHADH